MRYVNRANLVKVAVDLAKKKQIQPRVLIIVVIS